ncbi:MAG: hypothetical protein ACR2QW_16455 [bacterium]
MSASVYVLNGKQDYRNTEHYQSRSKSINWMFIKTLIGSGAPLQKVHTDHVSVLWIK